MIVGSLHLGDCHVQPLLPIWHIIAGSSGLCTPFFYLLFDNINPYLSRRFPGISEILDNVVVCLLPIYVIFEVNWNGWNRLNFGLKLVKNWSKIALKLINVGLKCFYNFLGCVVNNRNFLGFDARNWKSRRMQSHGLHIFLRGGCQFLDTYPDSFGLHAGPLLYPDLSIFWLLCLLEHPEKGVNSNINQVDESKTV